MITDVFIVYNNDNTIKRLGGTYTFKVSPFFHFIDDRTRKGKKDAWKLKNIFGSKLTPFVAIYEGDKPIRAFYSETNKDIIKELIDYLNGTENLYS
jgi:hypothetical protein